MATPHIYYYPNNSNLEVIDLGEELSDLTETPGAEVEDAVTVDGLFSRNLIRRTYKVRLYLERFGAIGGSSLERKLQTLESHLMAGGVIGFSRDETKAFCSLSQGGFNRGQTIFYGGSSPFSAWYSGAAPSVSDEIVIESMGAGAHREFNTVSAFSGGQVTLGISAVYSHPGHPLCRFRDFYPVLYLAKEDIRPTCIHDHRRNYTWEVTLTYSPAAVINLLDQRARLADLLDVANQPKTALDLGMRIKNMQVQGDFSRESAQGYQRIISGAYDPRVRF
jgi:hypothetical protein